MICIISTYLLVRLRNHGNPFEQLGDVLFLEEFADNLNRNKVRTEP